MFQPRVTRGLLCSVISLGMLALPVGVLEDGWAAEKEKTVKKEASAAPSAPAKAAKSGAKLEQPRAVKSFPSAAIAAKAASCFGITPKIEKVTPDEVKPGDRVTITGHDFGASGCLRSVSFGP